MTKTQAKAVTVTPTVALSKLIVDPANVRKNRSPEFVAEIAASIKHQGVLQSLLVRKQKGGKVGVLAGGNRLAALQVLAEAGELDNDFAVPVLWFEGTDEEAIGASQAENDRRKGMDLADEIEAYAKMHNSGKGLSPEDIASRFSVGVRRARALIKLGNLPEDIINQFRSGDFTLEHLEAFANCPYPDRIAEAMERIDELPYASHLRHFLRNNEINASHPLVDFVTLDAYKAAGGTVREDLFSQAEDTILEDKELLHRMADEKLEAVAAPFKEAGFADVVTQSVSDPEGSRYSTGNKTEIEPVLSDDGMKTLEALRDERQTYLNQCRDWKESEQYRAEGAAKHREAQAQIDKLIYDPSNYSDEVKAGARVTVWLAHNGSLCRFVEKIKPVANASGTGDDEKPKGNGISRALLADMLNLKTFAVQSALAKNTHVAKAVMLAGMLPRLGKKFVFSDSAIQLGEPNWLSGSHKDKLSTEREISDYIDNLKDAATPPKGVTLIEHLAGKSPEDLDALLAVAIARLINLNVGGVSNTHEAADSDAVTRALGFDMRTKYTVDLELLSRFKGGYLEDAVFECGTKEDHMAIIKAKTKKDKVVVATRVLPQAGWLPEDMRTPSYNVKPSMEVGSDSAEAEASDPEAELAQAA